MKKWQSKNPETVLRYNIHDTVVTARNFHAMRREMTSARQQRLYEHNKALSQLAAKMYARGFWVHQGNRELLAHKMLREIEEKEQQVLDLVAIEGFRCTPNDMRSLIFKRHATEKVRRFNLPDPLNEKMWSSKSTISVDFNALMALVTNPAVDPALKTIIDAYWDAEEVKKARSTFVVSELIDQAIGADGRLRAGFNSLGADTGRFTCRSPNLLTIPKHIRAMYGAPEGRVLVDGDHEQQELRVMARVANDTELQRRLDLGDVYTEDAKDWFGLPPETTKATVKPKARKQSKIIHLASQYAAGTKTVYQQALAQDRSLTYKMVAALHAGFKSTYSRTVDYWRHEYDRALAQGYSESRVMNRRVTYPRAPEISRVANYPIQSTAADIANNCILELDRRLTDAGLDAHVVCFFYDAFTVDAAEDDADKAHDILKECAELPQMVEGRPLSIPVSIKVGKTWDEV